VRGWVGWHHHVTLSFLAHHFLVRQRCRMGKKISSVDRVASPSVITGGAAAKGIGCRNGDRGDRVHARAELRGLLFPPEEDRGPARYILNNSRCNTRPTFLRTHDDAVGRLPRQCRSCPASLNRHEPSLLFGAPLFRLHLCLPGKPITIRSSCFPMKRHP
jgi:hypothetical protein